MYVILCIAKTFLNLCNVSEHSQRDRLEDADVIKRKQLEVTSSVVDLWLCNWRGNPTIKLRFQYHRTCIGLWVGQYDCACTEL